MNARTMTAAAGLLALAGAASADQFFFSAVIDGDQEVPPSGSPATGTLTGVYDDAANTFSFSWSISDELIGMPSAPGAHLHNAPAGQNGGIVFFMSNGDWPLDGDAVWDGLTPSEVDELFAGNLYANFHTTSFPGGEVRGQITLIPAPTAAGVLGLAGLAALRRRRA